MLKLVISNQRGGVAKATREVEFNSPPAERRVTVSLCRCAAPTALGASVQGFPVTYSVNGKQYLAVMTGLVGASPATCLRRLRRDIRIPQSGQAACRSTRR